MTDGSSKIEHQTPGIAKPNNLRMILLSTVILIAGIVIGSAGTTLIIQNSHRPPKPGAGSTKIITHKLRERLDLTDEQSAKIEPIIKTNMDKLRKYQQEARPKIEAVVKQMKEQISNLLTDDQNARWEKQIKDLEGRFRMHRESGRGRRHSEGRGGGPYGPRGDQGNRGFGPGGEGRRPRRMPDQPGQRGPGPGAEMWSQRQREYQDFQRPPTIQDQNTPQ